MTARSFSTATLIILAALVTQAAALSQAAAQTQCVDAITGRIKTLSTTTAPSFSLSPATPAVPGAASSWAGSSVWADPARNGRTAPRGSLGNPPPMGLPPC
jgi:hypothetical protein